MLHLLPGIFRASWVGSELVREHHLIACFLRSLLVPTITDWGFQKQMWDRVYGTIYLLGIKSVQGDRKRKIEQRKKSNWDVGLTDLAKLVERSGTNLLIIVFEVKMVRSIYLCLTKPPEGCSQKGVAHIKPYSSDEAKPEGADSCLVTSFPEAWHHIFHSRAIWVITESCLPHLFYLDAI